MKQPKMKHVMMETDSLKMKYVIVDTCDINRGHYIFDTEERAEEHLQRMKYFAFNKSSLQSSSSYKKAFEDICELKVKELKDEQDSQDNN